MVTLDGHIIKPAVIVQATNIPSPTHNLHRHTTPYSARPCPHPAPSLVHTRLSCLVTNRVSIIDRLENLRTFLIGAEIPESVQMQSLQIDDLEDPYHYIRTVKDGKGRNAYLLVGGEDHAVGVDNLQQQTEKFEALEKWMRERWPSVGAVTYQWTGQIQEPIDLLPSSATTPTTSPTSTSTRATAATE